MRAHRLAAGLLFCALGCLVAGGLQAKQQAVGTWQGMLPCPDCRGVRLRVSLTCEANAGSPSPDCRYSVVETFLGTRNGDITNPLQGSWSTEKGVPGDPAATVYRLAPARGEATRYFLVLAEDLRLLDAGRRDLEPKEKYTLRKVR